MAHSQLFLDGDRRKWRPNIYTRLKVEWVYFPKLWSCSNTSQGGVTSRSPSCSRSLFPLSPLPLCSSLPNIICSFPFTFWFAQCFTWSRPFFSAVYLTLLFSAVSPPNVSAQIHCLFLPVCPLWFVIMMLNRISHHTSDIVYVSHYVVTYNAFTHTHTAVI